MNEITFKDLKINLDTKLCYINNEVVNLSKSDYNILLFLLNNQNKVFSREELIKEVWNENVSDKAVNTAISRLRKKLGEYGKHIISRIGFGYCFITDEKV